MNIENLKVGMIAKNYKDLCRILEVEPRKDGSGKISHINELKQFFNFERAEKGHALTITEIYSDLKEHIDKRTLGNNRKYNLKDWSKEGLSCIRNTYGRSLDSFSLHSSDTILWECKDCGRLFNSPVYKITRLEHVKCIGCNMSTEARKIKSILDDEHINYKLEYIFNDLIGDGGRKLRFDFAIFDYNRKLLGIVEFDGGFHELNESTKTHDKIKNKYCSDNNIPLHRIHHTELFYEAYLFDFLNMIGCEMLFGRIEKEKNKTIDAMKVFLSESDNEIEKLKEKLYQHIKLKEKMERYLIES